MSPRIAAMCAQSKPGGSCTTDGVPSGAHLVAFPLIQPTTTPSSPIATASADLDGSSPTAERNSSDVSQAPARQITGFQKSSLSLAYPTTSPRTLIAFGYVLVKPGSVAPRYVLVPS